MLYKPKAEFFNEMLTSGWLMLLAFIIGIFGGFGAVVFRWMIGFVHNLSFNGKFSIAFNAQTHALPSVWGMGIIFVPVLGSFLVTWLTKTFAPEARGHGIPEVMDAIYYREGKIRPLVTVVKAIASAISVGTGGSVGREGPIVQIGSAFGSMLGQIVTMTARQRNVLIAAGAAAGIAATFNAPIGGLAFAIELMLVSVSAVNVALVAIATVTATLLSHWLVGNQPSFFVPELLKAVHHDLNASSVLLFVPFSILVGAVSALFIHGIYWFEDIFNRLFKNPYLRHAVGMFFLGIILYLLLISSGHYYVEGVGYATILDILKNTLGNPWFLLLLFCAKFMATGLTLGSGASGGVFSPSLFLGATLGAAFALLMQQFLPDYVVSPAMFAIAGMAAMVAGSTGAVLTAITMTFEQTRDYADILPIMVSVALAYAVRVRITNESIYTLKLFRRGRTVPQGLQSAIFSHKRARHLMNSSFAIVDKSNLQQWFSGHSAKEVSQCVIITENDKVVGVIRPELSYLRSDVDINKIIDASFAVVPANARWPSILRAMSELKAAVVLVSKSLTSHNAEDIIGAITQHEIFNSNHETAKLLD